MKDRKTETLAFAFECIDWLATQGARPLSPHALYTGEGPEDETFQQRARTILLMDPATIHDVREELQRRGIDTTQAKSAVRAALHPNDVAELSLSSILAEPSGEPSANPDYEGGAS